VLFAAAPVGRGEEPEWQIERQVEHGFGFCPVVWVQNLPAQDDIDGDPDCVGIYDLVESIDALVSQANKGTVFNCDPTLRIITDADMSEVSKGSENAIKLPSGSSADYMEISGSGPKAAMDMADALRKFALEVSQCVLDHPEMSVRTATEIERVYSSMLAKADILREQYGQRCVVPLVEMMLDAASKLEEGTLSPETGEVTRRVITLPPRIIQNEDGTTERASRKLGPGGVLGIRWSRYFEPGLSDIELAVRAAGTAQAGSLIDLEHAVRFVSEYFGIRDVAQLIEKLLAQKKDQAAQMEQQAMGGAAPGWGALGEEEEGELFEPPAAPEEEM
jgi:hypothetical protein